LKTFKYYSDLNLLTLKVIYILIFSFVYKMIFTFNIY